MKKTYLFLMALFCSIASAWAEDNVTWTVGSGPNDKANITWIGFTVPTTSDGATLTTVSLNNIHLCTNTSQNSYKTAYMVVASAKDINSKVAVSTNAPTPANNAFIEYTFSGEQLTAGQTYYMYFSQSAETLTSCGQRIAVSNANGNYAAKVGTSNGEKTWEPYFKVNVPDANTVPPVFSTTYGEKWLRLTNCNNTAYCWSAPSSSEAKTAQTDMSLENQLFCFVGNNTDGFDIYCKSLGQTYKLTASTSPGNGTAASWTTGTAAKWYLNMSQNGAADKPGIGVTTNVGGGYSLNMYNGAGGSLKFYGITDGGSRWTIARVNDTPTSIEFHVTGETKYPSTNTRIGDFKLTYGSTTSTTSITKDLDGTSKSFYLPYGEEVSMSTFTYRGWNASITDGTPAVVTFTGDTESDYQYLWYHNNPPYRIPAIATRKDGKLLAVNDYRPCGADIGFGRVDLVQRIGSDDGSEWEAGTTIITGNGEDSWNGNDGFGDPAICVDRETGRVLLMCVTGHTVCGRATRSNPNRIARFYSEDGGVTYHSVDENRDSIYDDITEDIYGLWDTEEYKNGDKTNTDSYTAQSFFVGSGRIFQSSKIKVGKYYRIYAALWSKDMHNRVAYSDDFGMTWHILGTRQDMPFPNFGNANEPKCEELPNGDVIISARKPNGRYYNIFTYSDKESGQGSWGTGTNSNISAPSDWNGTNGEIATFQVENADGELCNIVIQSLPLGLNEYPGDVRRNVGFYFKDITSPYSYQRQGKNDVATFASGWEKGMVVSTTQGSAYSTFTLQQDGKIGFFYEETPGGYSMVYVPLTISQITNGKYVSIEGDAKPTDATPLNITYSYKYGDIEWLSQPEVGYIGEAFPPVLQADYVTTSSSVSDRTMTAEDKDGVFEIACSLSNDYPFFPSTSYRDATWYSLTIRGTMYPYYNSETGKVVNSTTTVEGNKTLFAFVGNPFLGYRIMNIAMGAQKAIGGEVTNNGHVSAVDFESAPFFVLENNDNHLVLRNKENSLGYLNDINGTLGYWVNSSAATDPGSTLTFTISNVSTDICEILKAEPTANEKVYDLTGRQLRTAQPGICIVNRKKVVVTK